MTAQKEKLSAITASLTKIAEDLNAQPPVAPTAAPAATGAPEEIMALVDEAIQTLEVASDQIPAEKPEAVAPAAAPAAPITAKSKSAQDDDSDEKDSDDDKQKDAADDDEEDEEKKEMTARIAKLEGELFARQKSAIAEEFVQLYHENERQAKFNEIMKSDTTIETLTAQLKVAQEITEKGVKVARKGPVTTQGGYLVKQASMNNTVPAWRT
jgi:hypothetical protein